MHVVLTTARRRAVRRAIAIAVLLGGGLALVLGAPRARADYDSVVDGLEQWVWVRSDEVPLSAAVVRDDGWLVLATTPRFNGQRIVGGGLLLVPPWGGSVIPFGDPPDPRTKSYGFTSLVARGDRLFGLTSIPDQNSPVGQRARLFELDARSGKVVASHGTWWFPDVAVDPQTNDLVLWTFSCTGECGPEDSNFDDNNEEVVGAVSHEVVRYNPERREITAVLVPDAMHVNVGGSGTCFSRRDALQHCEEVFRIAFSADGDSLFLGTARTGTNAIDVRGRDGAFRFSIASPRPIDSMRFARPDSCLANALLFTSVDGTTWAVPNATERSAAAEPRQLAAGGPPGVSAAALTPDGNQLTVRRSEAVLLSCPGSSRVDTPRPPPPPGAPASPAAAAASPASSGAPAPPPAGTPPNPPPPVQPPSLPAVAGPASHATQAATGLNVGLADAEEQQPVYGLSASRRVVTTGERGPLLPLAAGAAGVMGFAAVAYVSIPDQRRTRGARPAFVRGDNPR